MQRESFRFNSRSFSTSTRLFTTNVYIEGKVIDRYKGVINKGLEPFNNHDPFMPSIISTFNKYSLYPTPKQFAKSAFRPILNTVKHEVYFIF